LSHCPFIGGTLGPCLLALSAASQAATVFEAAAQGKPCADHPVRFGIFYANGHQLDGDACFSNIVSSTHAGVAHLPLWRGVSPHFFQPGDSP